VTGVVSGQIKLSALPFRPKIQRPCHSSFEAALRHQTAAAISWLAMTFRWPADLPPKNPPLRHCFGGCVPLTLLRTATAGGEDEDMDVATCQFESFEARR